MKTTQSRIRPLLAATLACVFLQACEEESGGGSTQGVNGTYLHVSAPDFYFGTKDVGTDTTQRIQISNRGADEYPLKSVGITGDNSDDFAAEAINDIVLKPAQAKAGKFRCRLRHNPVGS